MPQSQSIHGTFPGPRITKFKYDIYGNLANTTYPDKTSYWTVYITNGVSEGLPEYSNSPTGVRTVYRYYNQPVCPMHIPGDAHNRAGMFAATIALSGFFQNYRFDRLWKEGFVIVPYNQRYTFFEKIRDYSFLRGKILSMHNYGRIGFHYVQDPMVTSVDPDILSNPLVTVDSDGVEKRYDFNELGLLLKDYTTGEENTYWCDHLCTRTRPVPEGGESLAGFLYDALGDVKFLCQGDQYSAFVRNAVGDVIRQNDGPFFGRGVMDAYFSGSTDPQIHPSVWIKGTTVINTEFMTGSALINTVFMYDERGLLLSKLLYDRVAEKIIVDNYAYNVDGNVLLHEDPCGWREGWKYNQDGWLTHQVDKRGAVRQIDYGKGREIYQETVYQPESIQKANDAIRKNSSEKVEGSTDVLKNGIRTIANNIQANGKILSQVSYKRDLTGRVIAEDHLWESAKGQKKKVLTRKKEWKTNSKNHIYKEWIESDSKIIGPVTIRESDCFGRIKKEMVTSGDKTLTTYSKYGAHGLVQTKTPDGTIVTEYLDRKTSNIYNVHESITTSPGTNKSKVIQRRLMSKTGLLQEHQTVLCPQNDKLPPLTMNWTVCSQNQFLLPYLAQSFVVNG